MFSTVMASCSVGGSGGNNSPTVQPVRSYSEKASYYDELVAGGNEPIPLTTSLNKSVFIEGDAKLLDEEVYQKVVDLANDVFPRIRAKYSDRGSMSITITLDGSSAGYLPCYAVGSTVVLNTEWFNDNPTESDVLIETFAAIVMDYNKADKIPAWLLKAMKLYIRDEYALSKKESGFDLPMRYNGNSYESDAESAAAFLKWVRDSQNVDIADRLSRQMRSLDGYNAGVWIDATGKTMEQLWTEYKKT